jgi:hypothetical protein
MGLAAHGELGPDAGVELSPAGRAFPSLPGETRISPPVGSPEQNRRLATSHSASYGVHRPNPRTRTRSNTAAATNRTATVSRIARFTPVKGRVALPGGGAPVVVLGETARLTAAKPSPPIFGRNNAYWAAAGDCTLTP